MRFLDVAAPYYPETKGDGTWITLAILAVIIIVIVVIVVVNKNKNTNTKEKKEIVENEKDTK